MAEPQNDKLTHLSVAADDIDEAAGFAVAELQGIADERGALGFLAPVLTQQSFEKVDGKWTRVFEFSAELLGVPGARS